MGTANFESLDRAAKSKEEGNAYYRNGRYEDALGSYRAGLEVTTNMQPSKACIMVRFDLQSNLVQTVLQLGKLDDNEHEVLLQMIFTSSKNLEHATLVKALYRCARVYMGKKQWEKASLCLRGCLTYDCQNEAVQKLIGEVQMMGMSVLQEMEALALLVPSDGSPESEIICTLCSKFSSGKQICKFHCGHLFHPKCILKWLNEKQLEATCPNCGREFV